MNPVPNYDAVISTPVNGVRLGIILTDSAVESIDILNQHPILCRPRSRLGRQVSDALQHYFDDAGFELTLPLRQSGTRFQQRVWQQLRKIRPGSTRHYGDIAKCLNTSARAVGNACRANPTPIIVPCHRVVAQQHLGGYCGEHHARPGPRLAFKAWLLDHEQH